MKVKLPKEKTWRTYLFFSVIFLTLTSLSYIVADALFHQESSLTLKIHHLLIWYDFLESLIITSLLIFGIIQGLIHRKQILDFFNKILGKPLFKGLGEDFNFPAEKVKALILPVSKGGSIVQEWLIYHLKPEDVAFIYTEESKEFAKRLIEKFNAEVHFYHTIAELEEKKDMLDDPYDPEKAKILTSKFINYYLAKYSPENIFVDITGGTVPISLGAFQSAEELGVSTIYVQGRGKDKRITNPIDKSQGRVIFISKRAK